MCIRDRGYGMTEVASAATVAAGKNNKPGSVGIPMVNTLVSAFEPGTDKELLIGQRGELCISGPATMKGYYNKPDETAMILHKHPDGRVWVHTLSLIHIWTASSTWIPASSGSSSGTTASKSSPP